jgi:hypothetical protein
MNIHIYENNRSQAWADAPFEALSGAPDDG